MGKKKIYWEILDKKRLKIVAQLGFLKKEGFYLAGGTAAALQMKHRISFDFDFYINGAFDADNILKKFQDISRKLTIINQAQNTLILALEGIGISLFTYSYKLVRPLIKTEYINIASLEDISSMKLIAIIQRGIRRDFIDIYFLIKEFGLDNIFKWTKKKYPVFNEYVGLQSLAYFSDAESVSGARRLALLKDVSWEGVKRYIVSEIREFKRKIEK